MAYDPLPQLKELLPTFLPRTPSSGWSGVTVITCGLFSF